MTSRTSFRFKIAVVGDAGVGKTSFVQQGVGEKFQQQELLSCAGKFPCDLQLYPKVLSVMKTEFMDTGIEMYIWDADGYGSEHGLQEMDYRKPDAVIMVYDITEWSSFEYIKGCIKDMKENVETSDFVISILGNKSDLEHDRQGNRVNQLIVQNFLI